MRETPEQRAKRLERERIRVREKRRQESPEQREKRLMKARERVRVRRSMETTEERQKRLKHNCEATRKARKERKEAWEAFTRASSVTTEGFEDNLIMTPPPIMNATQEILNRLLENSLLQQSAPSLPQLNTEFNLIKQESPMLDKKPILEYTDEVFFLMVKKEFEQLNQAQRETAKMKVLEALLLVKHSDNILT
uniref:Uncharacterized protein n=1 Tax=Acrobeloides nanus TaxID=290746 RepID=A0A914CPY5_9BILA